MQVVDLTITIPSFGEEYWSFKSLHHDQKLNYHPIQYTNIKKYS